MLKNPQLKEAKTTKKIFDSSLKGFFSIFIL